MPALGIWFDSPDGPDGNICRQCHVPTKKVVFQRPAVLQIKLSHLPNGMYPCIGPATSCDLYFLPEDMLSRFFQNCLNRI
jgi:hypothetical protein